MPEIRNSKSRGRPPRPTRCVVQLRQRAGGKVVSFYSFTVDLPAVQCMKRLQEAFGDVSQKFSRFTDNPMWRNDQ